MESKRQFSLKSNQNQAIRNQKHLVEKTGIGLFILYHFEYEDPTDPSHYHKNLNNQTLVNQHKNENT